MKVQTIQKGQLSDAYSYSELSERGKQEEDKPDKLTEKEMQAYSQMSLALKACVDLRNVIENESFGYFFKYPVNPYALSLSDYWKQVRKPMDLTTIKRKFFIGYYNNIRQFDQDMKLMFNNALAHNHHQDNIVT